MRVLITGGMGFIGLHTARAFLERGHEVVVTQFRVRRDPPFVRDEPGARLRREVLDVASPYVLDDVLRRHEIDQVLHLAVPGLGALPPAEDYRTNMDSLLNVLEASRRNAVQRVVVASSIVVYAGLPGPYVEHAALPVTSPNATSAFKKACEVLGLHYADRTQMDVAFARIGYVYGPLYHSMTNAPSRLVHAAVRGDGGTAAMPSAGDHYDYCYVKDCAEALVLLQSAPALPERIYNVGGGASVSNGEVARAVRAAVHEASVALRDGPPQPDHGSDAFLDLTLTARDTGYRPTYDIDRGIAAYAAWLRENDY